MKALWTRHAMVVAAFALLLVFAVGCSNDTPVGPISSSGNAVKDITSSDGGGNSKSAQVLAEGTVEVIFPEKNMFMLEGSHFEVFVFDETRAMVMPDGRGVILRLNSKFLSVGDLVTVYGYYDKDGLFMAELVEIWRSQWPNIDQSMQ